jgi:hypothetical protein
MWLTSTQAEAWIIQAADAGETIEAVAEVLGVTLALVRAVRRRVRREEGLAARRRSLRLSDEIIDAHIDGITGLCLSCGERKWPLTRVPHHRLRGYGRGETFVCLAAQFKAQRGRCYYCGVQLDPWNYDQDHKTSRLHGGGGLDENNIVCACPHCNAMKGWRSAEEFLRRCGWDGPFCTWLETAPIV